MKARCIVAAAILLGLWASLSREVFAQEQEPNEGPGIVDDATPAAQLLPTRNEKPLSDADSTRVHLRDSKQPLVLVGHDDWVTGVAFNPKGNLIASSSRDSTIRVWDVVTRQEHLTLKRNASSPSLGGHSGYVQDVTFSPDGRLLASAGSGDKTICLWNAASGRIVRQHVRDAYFSSVAFSPDSKLLAAANHKSIKVWNNSQDDPAGSNEVFSLDADMPLSVAFSPDGLRLAAVGRDHTIRVWNAVTGEEKFTAKHTDQLTCVAFSRDGSRLATASPTGVNLWDSTTGRMLLELNGSGGVSSVAFSPDGERLASGGSDKLVKLWDVNTGNELLTLKGHGNTVTSVAFSSDGTRLASGSMDRTIRVWDVTKR